MVILALALAACDENTVEVTRIVTVTVVHEGETIEVTRIITEEVEVTRLVQPATTPGETVTYHGYSLSDIPGLDPQLAGDEVSGSYIENLFVQLTNYDAVTSEVVPQAATTWDSSEDGLTWTFHLRTDIPWVYHNPVSGQTTHVNRPSFDESGAQIGEAPAFVTAHDFVASFRRVCDPSGGAPAGTAIAHVIAGCQALLSHESPGALSEADFETVGVRAADEATLVVELAFPAGYFLSMTPMWALSATPDWAIARHGHQWTEAGNIISAGPYVLSEWVHGVRRTLLRNELMPEDMRGAGNIERIRVSVAPDTVNGYAQWLNYEVDESEIPDGELAAHLEQFGNETYQAPDLAVFYFGFRHTKPPLDQVEVRRALSAAFDRQTFVDQVRLGQGLPMRHFAPPGIFGAPPIGEVGVGFDPQYAREQLAAAGYPDCEGFPTLSLLGFSGKETLDWLEYARAQWVEYLGCDADLFQIEQMPFEELLQATLASEPDETAPHIWTAGRAPEYADENNWVGDVLGCENEPTSKRECTETDELIVQAREEADPEARVALYADIEERFFGPEGEMPIAPLFLRIEYRARHHWLQNDVALFGGQQWYNWVIDWEAKQAAQGG